MTHPLEALREKVDALRQMFEARRQYPTECDCYLEAIEHVQEIITALLAVPPEGERPQEPRELMLKLPRRIEPLGGQQTSYVQLDSVLAILESAEGAQGWQSLKERLLQAVEVAITSEEGLDGLVGERLLREAGYWPQRKEPLADPPAREET